MPKMDGDRVEIVLDIHDDFVAGGADVEGKRLEKRTPSIKHFPSLSKRHRVGPLDMKESTVSRALKGLKLVSKNGSLVSWLEAEKRFDELSEKGLLKRSQFGQCIGLIRKKTEELSNSGRVQYDDDSRYFSERLFDSLCRQRNITDKSINKEQLKQFWEFWNQIADPSFDHLRLQTFFDMVDKDGDGMITKDEVKEIIILSALDNQLPHIEKKADVYATLIMEELDEEHNDYITIQRLETLLSQEPTNNVTGEGQNLIQMLNQNLKTTDHESNPIKRSMYEHLKYILHRNWKRCWVLVLWIGVMVGLFTWKYIQYKHRAVYHVLGSCVCIAKGAAETLKLNMAIMLLPVCRKTVTWLRNNTKLGAAVPFDDNINFHQVIAVAIAIGVGLHAISHLACDFPRLIHVTEEEYKPMQQYFGDQAQNYWHFVKEVEGYTGIIMVVLMTIAFTLATPWLRRDKFKQTPFLKKLTGFNAFWYSHHLFVIVYVMLIVHGIKLYLTKEWYKKTTWMYLAVPILIYACERLIRTFRSHLISTTSVPLRKVVVYPGNVLALHMEKPKGFNYKSGQYIFVKYAPISQFEWHPFSITSAPDDDYLSVHIRDRGDWTEKINDTFRRDYSLMEGTERYSCDFKEDENIPKVLIDGPYGAPSADYKEYDVVLLVGLGIGATPMISIVKDILNNLKAKEEEENASENGAALQNNKSGENKFRTKRAYFYWVTGQPDTSNWFKDVMKEVAEIDKNGVIEMHCYCKTVYAEGDARSAFIAMLRTVGYAKNGFDVVSDTRVMSHSGKPKWPDVYKRIALKHEDSKIGVFYCGNATGISDQKKLCFSHKTSTGEFVFHKENF